jgi:hypothetical protein
MERDDQKQTDEEIQPQKEAQDSELSDTDLEDVAGGSNLPNLGPGGIATYNPG